MNSIGAKLLSKSERAVLAGKKGKADILAEETIVKSTLKNMLGISLTASLEDGTEVSGTAIDMIVASTIQDAIENPSTTKLKDLTNILGELKDNSNVELNISAVDLDLQKRALGGK